MTARTHTCPASKCTTKVPQNKLMCPAHWRLVPKALQDDVYRTYRLRTRGGRYVAEHHNAMLAATRAVNAKLSQVTLNLDDQ